MWYMPYLRARHAVLVYVYIITGVSLAAIAVRYYPGAIQSPIHIGSVGLAALLIPATALVGGLATVMGLNLAAENDGHLEVAWTKPVSREGYALGVFAVDIVAMAACIVFTALCFSAVLDAFAGHQALTFMSTDDHTAFNVGFGDTLFGIVAYCGLPLCVYAWVTALSASFKRNRGGIAGAFWPVMVVLSSLKFVPIAAVHSVIAKIDLFNPIDLYTVGSSSPGTSVWTFAWGWAVAAILLAASLVQWRRLQL